MKSKEEMREYQRERRRKLQEKKDGIVCGPMIEVPHVEYAPVGQSLPVLIDRIEELEKRVSEIEARFAVDGVVMDAVGSRRRGRSVVVGDSPEDLFKRVVAGKVARLGVR